MHARFIPAVLTPATVGDDGRLATPLVRRNLPEIGLGLFCLFNLVWIAIWHGAEAFPVHFMFISLSVVFGLRMWSVRNSLLALLAVAAPIFLLMLRAMEAGQETATELAEAPLMSVLFLVMIWHVRKRQRAIEHERALFANASHELMTPLTIASGELELLGRHDAMPAPEEFRAARLVILEELQRGRVLAAGLLTISRLDSSSGAQRSVTPTDHLLDAAMRRWSGVTDCPLVVTERAGGDVLCVRPDIGLLLDNLIENAVRHAPGGSRVTLAARARGSRLVLEVSDQGEGIADDVQPYIFDRFFRARCIDGTRGSGLGLAIVKGIAESHGGTVAVESALGVGTTFRVELPGFEREASA